MFSRQLTPEERSVRGSLVTGLNESDMWLLDIYEGDVRHVSVDFHTVRISNNQWLQEYTREVVSVHPLSAPTTLSPQIYGHQTSLPNAAPHSHSPASLPPPIRAQAYIWCKPPTWLTPSLWSFEDFVNNNAWKWVGVGSVDNHYLEVDRRRAMGGYILRCGVARTGITETPEQETHRMPTVLPIYPV